jgi:tRNA threonylcarbamoyladenosine biosynthesis protein TsaE
MSRRLHSNSPEETEKLAREFARELQPGDWVALSGVLGAGKTVWARGIGRGLDVTNHITSPTYTLISVYEGRVRYCHLDLYRVRSAEELIDFGLENYDDGRSVIVVEWAENLPDAGLPFRYEITIERTGETQRMITVNENLTPERAGPR